MKKWTKWNLQKSITIEQKNIAIYFDIFIGCYNPFSINFDDKNCKKIKYKKSQKWIYIQNVKLCVLHIPNIILLSIYTKVIK